MNNDLTKLPAPPKDQTGITLDQFKHLPSPPQGQQGLTLEQVKSQTQPNRGGVGDPLGQISNAFKGGVSQMKQAISESQAGRNPLETGAKWGAGAIGTLFSPLAPVFQPLGEGINAIANKISDIPAIQKFAMGKGGAIASRVAETTGNLATLAGTAASFVKPPTAGLANTAGVGENAVSLGLRSSAEESIAKALGATTKANKVLASKLAPQILDRPMSDTFALTRQGLEEKAIAGKEAAGQAIGDFGKLEGTTNTSDVINTLESEKAQYMAGGKVVNAEAVSRINDVQDIIHQYGDVIDNETLRSIKRIFDDQVAKTKGFAIPPSEGTKISIVKLASDKIRGILADTNPDLAKLNKEYNFWSNLEKVVGDTTKRTQSQSGFGKDIATMAGAVSGHGVVNIAVKALTFRWIASAIKSTGWRLLSGKIKNSIADAMAIGDFSGANDILRGISKTSIYAKEWEKTKQSNSQ